MSIEMTATEAKAKLLRLLDQVEAGEEVTITRHGKTVARLVPARARGSAVGRLTGMAVSVPDDDLLFSTGLGWEAS